MLINKYGQTILSSDNLRELLLQGKNIGHLNVEQDEDIQLYEKYQDTLLRQKTIFLDAPAEDLSFDDFHKQKADEWIFPLEYQQIDVLAFLLAKCNTLVFRT